MQPIRGDPELALQILILLDRELKKMQGKQYLISKNNCCLFSLERTKKCKENNIQSQRTTGAYSP
jgi:hypothetical protein